MNTLLSLGHGYSAQALARLLIPQGWRVIGTTRSAAKAQALRAQGVEPILWQDDLTSALAQSTHFLSSIAPDESGDPVLLRYGQQIAATPLHWGGYLSTTAVYGDHKRAWVAAERAGAARGPPLHIFRLVAIYGPGRGPYEKVRDGTARRIIKTGQVFSRTHVQDIAQVLAASIARPAPGGIYNVCDDDPAPPEDVLSPAARLLGLPAPPAIPYETAEMTPMARSFYAESKRVRNDRIKADLGLKLLYPTYREGLAGLLSES